MNRTSTALGMALLIGGALVSACGSQSSSSDSAAGEGPLSPDDAAAPPNSVATSGVDAWGFAGHCDAALSVPGTNVWASRWNGLVVTLGQANHRLHETVMQPGNVGPMFGRFRYLAPTSPLGIPSDIEGEEVQLWVRTCPGWTKVASVRTDSHGQATFDATKADYATFIKALPKGDYQARMVLTPEGSALAKPEYNDPDRGLAVGTLGIWPAGTKVVVADVDGTLNTADSQLFAQIADDTKGTPVKAAADFYNYYASLGYKTVYLTGRPPGIADFSRAWLKKNGFPYGLAIFGDEQLELTIGAFQNLSEMNPLDVKALPGVADFKTHCLQDDLSSGYKTGLNALFFQGAFGDMPTDAVAYINSKGPDHHNPLIDPKRVWIRGTNGVIGADGHSKSTVGTITPQWSGEDYTDMIAKLKATTDPTSVYFLPPIPKITP